ncbi:MAG: hypothetical protein RSH26_07715 [Clostridia bacterium]
MTAWFRRARQTRTPVHSAASEARSKRRGALAAYRVMISTQIATQLLLWVTLYAYDETVQAAWQAAVLLIVPLCALWGLWRAGKGGLRTHAGKLIGLALLPCLLLDTMLLLHCAAGLMTELIPAYSRVLRPLLIAALCCLTACLGRENGVAYGVSALRMLNVLLFLLATVFLNADADAARLWPLLGQGVGRTAMSALGGSGAVWAVGLLFVLPFRKEKAICAAQPSIHPAEVSTRRSRTVFAALLPWVGCVIWALCYGMARPWNPGDTLTLGERLMGLARHSRSMLLSEISGFWWLILLPCSLAGSVICGQKLLRHAAPKLPRSLAAAALIVPPLLCELFFHNGIDAALKLVLPWRGALSLLAGGAMLLASAKGVRA